ncbi:ribonuclease H-like domain-containing protein [Tanacetum coccineum]
MLVKSWFCIQQLMKMMQFLMNLDDCYQPTRSALLTKDLLLDVKDAYTTVSREESHRGVPETFGVSKTKMNANSFTAKTFNNNNNTKRSFDNKIGHTIDGCFEIVGFPPGFKRNNNSVKQGFNANVDIKMNDKQSFASHSSGFTFEHMQKLLSLITDNTFGSIRANMASRASFLMAILGHLVDQVLSVLHNDLKISKSSSMPVCEVCHRAKQTRDPFPLSSHKSKELGHTQNDSVFGQEDVQTHGLRRSSRPSTLPARFNDYVVSSNVKYGIEKFVSCANLSKIEAMHNEIEALNRNNTWYVCDLPYGRKAIGCKWIYKIKYKASSEIERYKVRLVAKGFSQREGFDNDETFSPVIKMVTVRCLISDVFVALLVYVDDIVITGNDETKISNFKRFLSTRFMIKDLGVLKYFLGIEIIKNDNGLCMSQRKYFLELLHEYGLLVARPVDIPLPEKYYFEPDISYDVHCLSQHMHSPLQSHFKDALRVLRLGNLLLEYRSTSSASCEIVWLGNLLHSLGLKILYPVELCCDNSSTIQIATNPVFHERTKHFELGVHFVREKVLAGVIKTVKVPSKLQTADIFTKCLGFVQHCLCCENLGMQDVFAGELVGKEKGRS